MAKVNQQIVGLGGHGTAGGRTGEARTSSMSAPTSGASAPAQTRALMRHVLSLTGRDRPRVMHVPTATGDGADGIVAFYERCSGLGDLSHLTFHPWPPRGLRELALDQDAISVGGGNTANMLAIWRVHGFDRILREAWNAGVLLFGASAGMICWFEAGVTDSFGPELEGMRDGLGFLAGSACPHYDGEALRRPRYRELVDGGFPEGIAADDGVGLHYFGTGLHEVITCRPDAAAYRVTRNGEERLPGRLIPT